MADLNESLKKYFGFNNFKGEQKEIIQNVLDGKDTFVIMPTGGGKSMCYQLPALILDGTALIISPLIALMKNQVDSIRGVSEKDSIAHFLNSSLNKSDQLRVKDDLRKGKTKILYIAPETLTKKETIDFFKELKISLVAVDEAHCISEWGHDFRPEYRRIKEMIKGIDSDIPVMALTATATPKVQGDIQKNLGMSDATVFKASFNRENLFYEVRPKVDVLKQIILFAKERKGKSGIIYCLSRKKVEELAETLQVNGIKALPYHAGFDSNTRAGNQDKFLNEDTDVIVATIAFGMGIDKPDVRYVIHHDMPKSLEGYYQETGRAGRDGGEGHCLAFYDYKDIEKLEKFMAGKPVAEQEVGRQLLEEVVAYAETAMSRRKFLLHYFGEEFDEEDGVGAKMDDNAVNPRPREEGSDKVKLVLDCINELRETAKAKYVIKILLGVSDSEVKSYKHDKNECFGKGKDREQSFWMAVIRQVIVAKLLRKEIESYGVLKLTDTGRDFIANPKPFTIILDHDYVSRAEDDSVILNQKAGGGATDENLFKLLKDITKSISKAKNVPPFAVFQETSLMEMATQYPITMEELTNIQGVGMGKANKFGSEIIAAIAEYVEENNIERPQDFVVKSVVNKSGTKVYIIQNIDRKRNLEDIASAKGLTFDELLTEIENIVDSGTRVNLDYYLNAVLDEDKQEELFDFFQDDAETGTVEEAMEELADEDYKEDDIRLMRIKFMSETAN
ncbi:MAG: DNA helicase RecQ [Crocinitomicaceae bacterium]|nr:DNA helicase RecQ [Crocinitomicaceae bacterium]|tara:strand:- start:4068 stop:6263 length:2196 start_codon:yes stop_codon:yes gene_type:complete